MVNALVQDGTPVVTLDRMGYAASPLAPAPLRHHPLYRLVCGSIGDTSLVAMLLREVKLRAVLNFAAPRGTYKPERLGLATTERQSHA
jgi:dTDP-D-glucose 4,6-dehydratase